MQVVTVLFYGLPLQELQTFRERVNAVTVDDIQRVSQKYLRPDRLSVVLVGNASAFASQLRGVGFGTFETVELPDLDLIAANFKRGPTRAGRAGEADAREWSWPSSLLRRFGESRVAYQQAPAAAKPAASAAEESAKAVALLDKAIAAKGGLEKLRAIKTIVATQTVSTRLSGSAANPDGFTTFETTNYIQYPDRLRIQTYVAGNMNVQASDGTEVWVKDPRGVRAQPDSVARQVRLSLRRDVVALLLAAKAGTVTPRMLPDVKSVFGRMDHVLELSAPDLGPILLYINLETSLIDKLTFVDEAPTKPLVEESFSDYRDVDGVKIPFHGIRQIGTQSVERYTSSVEINRPIDPSLFKRPTS
jgi:hypothetical protein